MSKRTKIEVTKQANVMLTDGKRMVLDKGVITYADILKVQEFGAFANVTDKEVTFDVSAKEEAKAKKEEVKDEPKEEAKAKK